MKTRNFITAVAAAAAVTLTFACSSKAIPTQVDSTYLLGITTGSPANESTELGRLNTLIAAYNAGTLSPAPGVNVPAAPITSATINEGHVDENATSFGIDLGTSHYEYLMVKWADKDAFYYIGNLTGALTIVNDVVLNSNGRPQGASHYDLFDPFTPDTQTVPDGGTTVLLFGAALTSLALLRHKLSNC